MMLITDFLTMRKALEAAVDKKNRSVHYLTREELVLAREAREAERKMQMLNVKTGIELDII